MILIKPNYTILTDINSEEILKLIERIGRVCYKSEDKITPNSSIQFCNMLKKREHWSVLEHFSFSVKFIVDRGVTHELVRHRLASYSQESTRYCNYKGGVTFIIPPWVNVKPQEYNINPGSYIIAPTDWEWYNAMLESERTYIKLLKLGWNPQQARSVLPNSLKTEIITTANLREWGHIFKLRTSQAAHPQMREIMCPLLDEVRKKIPVIYDDIGLTQ